MISFSRTAEGLCVCVLGQGGARVGRRVGM